MDWAPQAIREGILTILFISGPLVLLAAGLGLTVGILQAATQIQEQTLASAVKIIGLFLALIIGGFYMFSFLQKFATENIERAFKLVPSLGTYVKPRRNFLTVPLDESTDNQLRSPTELNEPIKTGRKGPSLSSSLDEPEHEVINENKKRDSLGIPKTQRKEPNENIKKQELEATLLSPQVFREAQKNSSGLQQQSLAKPIAKSNSSSNPIKENTQISDKRIKPQKEKRSLTDALSRIRESIDEFNSSQGVNP